MTQRIVVVGREEEEAAVKVRRLFPMIAGVVVAKFSVAAVSIVVASVVAVAVAVAVRFAFPPLLANPPEGRGLRRRTTTRDGGDGGGGGGGRAP